MQFNLVNDTEATLADLFILDERENNIFIQNSGEGTAKKLRCCKLPLLLVELASTNIHDLFLENL